MDVTMITARLIHVLGGIFWVGAMVFVTAFLLPSMAEAGPDGAKVMAGINKRRFMQITPVVALLVILSGLYMYWRISGEFDHAYLVSVAGHVYAFGGIFATVAFIVGISVTRPSMMKSMALSQAAMSASGEEKDRLLAQAQAMRVRGGKAGTVVTWLLILAAIAMAIGRYV